MWIRAAEIVAASAAVQPDQLRAARALLGWSLMEASRRSRLSVAAVNAVEDAAPHIDHQSNIRKLCAAYEAAGVGFDNRSGVNRGVSLRSTTTAERRPPSVD